MPVLRTLLSLLLLCGPAAGFRHPGTLMNAAQVRALWTQSKSVPWSSGLDKVRRWIIPNVQPSAIAVIKVYWPSEPQHVTNGGMTLVTRDAPQAYMHALMYLATKEAHYAETAMHLVSAWAVTNKKILGGNAPLVAGWSQSAMAQTVELLRYRAARCKMKTACNASCAIS
jgi:hypothetical protein